MHYQELQGSVNAQQTIISQSSQALNLCRATTEFYGSTEQIEGERLLLIASEYFNNLCSEAVGFPLFPSILNFCY